MNERSILLVEDNPDDEELVIRTLKQHNVTSRIAVARDGAAALDYLFATGAHSGRDTTDTPAVVLLDLKLPKLDGLEVLQKIRADGRTKLIPVVVFTSSTEEQDLVRSYELGCNSFIRKPVDFGQFAEAIRELGLYWLLLNEPLRNAG